MSADATSRAEALQRQAAKAEKRLIERVERAEQKLGKARKRLADAESRLERAENRLQRRRQSLENAERAVRDAHDSRAAGPTYPSPGATPDDIEPIERAVGASAAFPEPPTVAPTTEAVG